MAASTKTYPVERIMLGTRDVGGFRAIVVNNRRQAQRGPAKTGHTLERWARRQWRKFEADWERIGNPEISISDHGDLWLRNQAAIRLDQRAVRRDADLAKWLDGKPLRADIRANLIEVPLTYPADLA